MTNSDSKTRVWRMQLSCPRDCSRNLLAQCTLWICAVPAFCQFAHLPPLAFVCNCPFGSQGTVPNCAFPFSIASQDVRTESLPPRAGPLFRLTVGRLGDKVAELNGQSRVSSLMAYYPRNVSQNDSTVVDGGTFEWEEVDCLLCGSGSWQTLLEAPDRQGGTGLWFAVVQCHDCGLCFTNPRPAEHCLGRFYPRDYRPHQLPFDHKRSLSSVRSRLRRLGLPRLEKGRLLDFGCGGGSFLQDMHRLGWEVVGLDQSETAVERLRRQTGIAAIAGSLPHPDLQPRSFDLITMWHSLEHVPRPANTLQAARELLRTGGRLVVSTPNIDSMAFRMFGQQWLGLDLPRHLTHFAPWTLHLMLERAGFRVETMRMVRRSSWLRHSARLARSHPEASPFHRLMRGKFLSRLAAWYSCATGQSDCMTAVARL